MDVASSSFDEPDEEMLNASTHMGTRASVPNLHPPMKGNYNIAIQVDTSDVEQEEDVCDTPAPQEKTDSPVVVKSSEDVPQFFHNLLRVPKLRLRRGRIVRESSAEKSSDDDDVSPSPSPKSGKVPFRSDSMRELSEKDKSSSTSSKSLLRPQRLRVPHWIRMAQRRSFGSFDASELLPQIGEEGDLVIGASQLQEQVDFEVSHNMTG